MLQQAHPGVPGIGASVTEFVYQVGDQYRHEVGRHDTPQATECIAAHQRWRPTAGGSPHPRAEQQETRQYEEDRHTDLQTRKEQPDIAMRELPVPYAAWVPTISKTATARRPVSDAIRSAVEIRSSPPGSTSGIVVSAARSGSAFCPPEPGPHPRTNVAEEASISSRVPNYLQTDQPRPLAKVGVSASLLGCRWRKSGGGQNAPSRRLLLR